jgi:hypothetical protein
MLSRLEEYMLPCMSKLFFGIDCPMCGFQRALLLLVQGEFLASFYMYPPLLPVLYLIGAATLKLIASNSISNIMLTRTLYFTIGIIFISYVVKLIVLI